MYSIILFDTDLNEEVWVEEAAHHGVIYDLKWSKDDRFLLSCSGDGTCKVWDMLPVSYRANNTMGFGVLNNNGDSGNSAAVDDPSSPAGIAQQALRTASSKPPSLVQTLVASPPVYSYSGVFQDQKSPASTTSATASTATAGGANVKDSLSGLSVKTSSVAALVPRIITGAADGRLRVWEGAEMLGYVHIVHKEKDNAEETVDHSPHEGQVNAIVIDERSR